MAKMMRVFYIFNNPTPKKKVVLYIFTGFWYHISTLFIQKVKDLHLFVFIGALITVDLLILVIYTFIQGVNGNINAQKSVNTERPSDEEGVSIITTSPVITFLISIYLIIGSSC